VSKEVLEVIWQTITRDVERFSDTAGIGPVNSKRWTRVDETLEELAVMLVEDVFTSEAESLTALTEGIWQDIHDRMIEWALSTETARVERRMGVAS
jgi:hypothetical protein